MEMKMNSKLEDELSKVRDEIYELRTKLIQNQRYINLWGPKMILLPSCEKCKLRNNIEKTERENDALSARRDELIRKQCKLESLMINKY